MSAVERDPRRILVTGGAGFIGSNFVRHCLDHMVGDALIVLDALTYAGSLTNLADRLDDPRLRFVHGDICDSRLVSTLLAEHDVDAIVHFAAESHVDRSIRGPDDFVRTNIVGTHELLKVARAAWGDRDGVFHHVSTDEVFGSLAPDAPPVNEAAPYAPNSPYAASKAAADHLVRSYHRTFGLRVVTTNCSNNYGPYQFPEKLIPLVITNALDGLPLPVYGDGLNVRDWLYVSDHCRALVEVLRRGAIGHTYNVGGRAELANRDVVARVCRVIDGLFAAEPELAERFPNCPPARGERCERLITFVSDRPGHDRRYALSDAKIARELGFVPEQNVESGLRRTVRWYLDNEPWWREIKAGSYRDWYDRQYARTTRPTQPDPAA